MKIKERFRMLGKEGKTAFMPYICVGDPTEEDTVHAAKTLISSGADLLELGLPFSDPIADGPTIQKASQRSLASGMNTDKYFRVCKRISGIKDIPLVSMTYYNLVLQYGLKRYVSACRASGVTGLIVPDLPVEESMELDEVCRREGVDLIQFISLTTDEDRMDRILSRASGFIYLVSVLGVTGARKEFNKKISETLEKIKQKTDLPVCLGFGVSKKEHVTHAKKIGLSGVIIGSALIEVIEKNLDKKQKMLKELESLARTFSEAT